MRASERGFSLMEVTVVLAVVSVIMILTYRMIEETARTSMFSESHNDLTVMSQAAVNTLQAEVLQTRMAFQEDALGVSYRGALALPAANPVWTTSLLPVIDAATVTMTPDPADRRFAGNSLLLARQMPPLTVTYDHDDDAGTAEVELLADRYRFEYVYLSPNPVRSFAGSGITLDLIMVASAEYADYFQLSTLTAGRGAIVRKLIAAGLQRAWDPGQPLDSAFYALSAATDGTFDGPLTAPRIDVARTRTLLRGLLGGRVTGNMSYSVAFTPAGRPPFALPLPSTSFARADASRPGFPAGFEVKIVGPAGNRQVMTRLLLMSHIRGRFEAQQAFMTTAARF